MMNTTNDPAPKTWKIELDGVELYYTGKFGRSFATGERTFEFASDGDTMRAWLNDETGRIEID